jgi:hypothetical protein
MVSPARQGPANQPLVHEVGHEGGRDDGVTRLTRLLGAGARQKPIEEFAPFLHDEAAGRVVAHLAGDLTLGVAVNDQQLAVTGSAALSRLLQLTRVETAVAATSDDHNVAEGNTT